MSKFRKKPVVIEAWRWMGNGNIWPEWLDNYLPAQDGKTMIIQTLEGVMKAQLGDWIICGVKGEVYPCKPDIFAETYEPV